MQTRNISVTSVNDDPTNLGSLPSDVSVTEDVLANIDLSAIELSDADHSGSALTVTLTTGLGGNLTAQPGSGISVGGTSTALTITGTLDDLNTYFDNASNIQYLHTIQNLNGDDADVISVVVNDNGNSGTGGGTDQNLGVVNVDITAVDDNSEINLDADNSSGVGGAGFAATFVEGGGGVRIADSDATVDDVDGTVLNQMTATINNLLNGVAEQLTANTTGTLIAASYDSGTGVLTLSGTDTLANYQQVLRTIEYEKHFRQP